MIEVYKLCLARALMNLSLAEARFSCLPSLVKFFPHACGSSSMFHTQRNEARTGFAAQVLAGWASLFEPVGATLLKWAFQSARIAAIFERWEILNLPPCTSSATSIWQDYPSAACQGLTKPV